MPGPVQKFDAASVAALQAAVAARCIAFSLTAQSTQQSYVDHYLAPFTRPIGKPPYVLLTVAATYRTPGGTMTDFGNPANPIQVKYGGVQRSWEPAFCQIVCDASNQTVATGLLLQWINAQFDQYNLQFPTMLVPAHNP